ncbi:hypothetical protein ACTMU2_31790 [Cupriavidus basilensis]
MKIGDAFSEYYEIILNGLLMRPVDGDAVISAQADPRTDVR